MNESNIAFFTIVARNYEAYAKTLCDSIKAMHPTAKIYIGLSDDYGIGLSDDCKEFEVISVPQLALPSESCFIFRYDVMEFSTAIKPYVFRWISENSNVDKIIYLDPDILVVSPLKAVIEGIDRGATAMLTPHLTQPIEDDFMPDEMTMLKVGAYNLGFIAIANNDEGRRLINWWCMRLERGAVVDLENGLFTDQKWADLIPGLFDRVEILRNPGYNVAYWNLMHRDVRNEKGHWVSNGQPLSFFHFSGINPALPENFSKHQNRFNVGSLGEVDVLYKKYLSLLICNNYFDKISLTYGYGTLDCGLKIDRPIRVYFRLFMDDKSKNSLNPFFHIDGKYLNALEERISGNNLITRYMYALYMAQKELQLAFNLNNDVGIREYANFFVNLSKINYRVNNFYVEEAKNLLQADTLKNPKSMTSEIQILGRKPNTLIRGLVGMIFVIYKRNPGFVRRMSKKFSPEFVDKVKRNVFTGNYVVFKFFDETSSEPLEHPAIDQNGRTNDDIVTKLVSEKFDSKEDKGLTLIGYVKGDFGVAQNLRAAAAALLSVNYSIDMCDIPTHGLHSETTTDYDKYIVDSHTNGVQLFCVNADQTAHVASAMRDQSRLGEYKIGYWFWELANFPAEWSTSFAYLNEVWAPSKFVYDSIKEISPIPVVHIPVAVEFKINGNYDRTRFGLPSEKFLFLFSFDFHSFQERKNPEAVIAEFIQAFPASENKAGLVIKVSNADKHIDKYNKLLRQISSFPCVTLINTVLSRDEMYGLINSCDCYVSLHRSEGFGLGLAEAMFLGKPVIATGYSGNMDFTRLDNSCLVDYTLVDVPVNAYPYHIGQVWAEPVPGHAAYYMRRLLEDEPYRNNIAQKGQETVRLEFSHKSIGQRMESRLNTIHKL